MSQLHQDTSIPEDDELMDFADFSMDEPGDELTSARERRLKKAEEEAKGYRAKVEEPGWYLQQTFSEPDTALDFLLSSFQDAQSSESLSLPPSRNLELSKVQLYQVGYALQGLYASGRYLQCLRGCLRLFRWKEFSGQKKKPKKGKGKERMEDGEEPFVDFAEELDLGMRSGMKLRAKGLDVGDASVRESFVLLGNYVWRSRTTWLSVEGLPITAGQFFPIIGRFKESIEALRVVYHTRPAVRHRLYLYLSHTLRAWSGTLGNRDTDAFTIVEGGRTSSGPGEDRDRVLSQTLREFVDLLSPPSPTLTTTSPAEVHLGLQLEKDQLRDRLRTEIDVLELDGPCRDFVVILTMAALADKRDKIAGGDAGKGSEDDAEGVESRAERSFRSL